jgi:hypothetical protein
MYLSLVTNFFGVIPDLGEDWIFIAPTTKVAVGEGFCRMAHLTVRCASHVTRPLGSDHWSF